MFKGIRIHALVQGSFDFVLAGCYRDVTGYYGDVSIAMETCVFRLR